MKTIHKKPINDEQRALLNEVASHTVIATETPTESFALYRKDLLLSDDWSSVLIPVFNLTNIVQVIQIINLCYYLKTKHQCKIYIIIDSRLKYIQFFRLFPLAYDKLLLRKRFFQIAYLTEQHQISKLVYHPFYAGYIEKDFPVPPIQISPHVLIQNSKVKAIKKEHEFKILSCSKDEAIKNDNLVRLLLQDAHSVICINRRDLVVQQLYLILNAEEYVHYNTHHEIDYLVPFLNANIIDMNSHFYAQDLFTYSASVINGKVTPICKLKMRSHQK